MFSALSPLYKPGPEVLNNPLGADNDRYLGSTQTGNQPLEARD
jgi:hypothetical protein